MHARACVCVCVCVWELYLPESWSLFQLFAAFQSVSKNCPAMASVTFGDGLTAIQAWALKVENVIGYLRSSDLEYDIYPLVN